MSSEAPVGAQNPDAPPNVANIADQQPATSTGTAAREQEVGAWSVDQGTDAEGNVLPLDYDQIRQKWATQAITPEILERFEKVTGHKPHRWMRRGLFFSHRDLEKILDTYERGEPFFLYTGRGPSSDSMHVGHTVPFEFTRWLQEVFDVPLVIMMTDDEKALFNASLTFEGVLKLGKENMKDILSMGYDVKKTFIYSDIDYLSNGGKHFLLNSWEFSKLVTFNQVRGAFGFDQSTGIGRIFFPSLQCVAAFATSYPAIWGEDPMSDDRSKQIAAYRCLIPCGIDQDPYFRLVRDNSLRMKNPTPKPALIHSKFLTALQGPGGKMSASKPNTAIFMNDTPKQIKNKINKHAFSGGQETLELHRELGGNPDVDVAFQYLTYFLEDDDRLKEIETAYRKGEMLTGELKKICITLLEEYTKGYQERRAKITDETLKAFMTPRKLEWKGNPNPKKDEGRAAKELAKELKDLKTADKKAAEAAASAGTE